jgi:hypothetical protein
MTLGRLIQPDSKRVIELAEDASRLSVGQWSIKLLQTAFPESQLASLLALPASSRDRLVLMIRQRLVSTPLRAEPVCSACGETYELTLNPDDFGLAEDAPWPEPGFRVVSVADRELRLRPVNLGDLLAVETELHPDQAANLLAERVCDKQEDGVSLDLLADALETLDPAADIWLEIRCPECGSPQSVAFDPVHFVAHEICLLSQKILRDVVDIARVFHWSEGDILALPERRRAYYVSEALS